MADAGMGLAPATPMAKRNGEALSMFKRIAKYGKWFAIIYVAQALVGTGAGIYAVWSGSTVFGYDMTP